MVVYIAFSGIHNMAIWTVQLLV